MSRNILVTGGAGYIGSVLVPDLLDAGHKVTVVDNLMYKQTSLSHIIRNKNFTFTLGDVRDESLMKSQLKNCDIIIPLAAIVGAPACVKDPDLATSTNRDSIFKLLKIVSKSQHVIMPTTNSAYGSGGVDNFCNEESELRPLSLYARDKVEVEKALFEIENYTSFRLATVFGISPRMRLDLLVNNFVHRALHDKFIVLFEGHFKRNYIHLIDVCQAFTLAIDQPNKFVNQVFNVGLSDANISKIELTRIIQRFIHDFVVLEAELHSDPDQRNYVVSNSKIEATGFKPKVSLENGILELIKGFEFFNHQPFTNL